MGERDRGFIFNAAGFLVPDTIVVKGTPHDVVLETDALIEAPIEATKAMLEEELGRSGDGQRMTSILQGDTSLNN